MNSIESDTPDTPNSSSSEPPRVEQTAALNQIAESASTAELETNAHQPTSARYVLRLYVTGISPHSARAIVNVRKICEEHLQGCYDLEVIDLSQSPGLAETEQIIAIPTLVKQLPLPLRHFIGDMSQTERILLGLDLRVIPPESQSSSAEPR